MQFRTIIEQPEADFTISHDDRIVMLGSCFTDAVGELLHDDGFNVIHNPCGPLFNPASVARVIEKTTQYQADDFYNDDNGEWHCLDYASRFRAASPEELASIVNPVQENISRSIENASIIIITLGSARVYDFIPGGYTAGNCHRLPSRLFNERMLDIDEIVKRWQPLIDRLPQKIIFTLSPIRYTARGLVENSLSKAVLRVAIDTLCRLRSGINYFPAFEILNDDLRDYRFYADDLKHPSKMAVEYIYGIFSDTYFTAQTKNAACCARREASRSRHVQKDLP